MNNIGVIYKITNLVNQKIYIGQTKQYYLDRWNQHKREARQLSTNKISKAIRRYGENNFKVEIIEKCFYEDLDEREIYWIKYYNSVENGYNISYGGQTHRENYYELENPQEIIDYYYQCHDQKLTCKHFNITEYKFRQLLTKNNLPTDKTKYGKHTKEPVKIVELDKTFDSGVECAQFFIDNNICQSKKIECVRARLSYALKNNKKIYGYTVIKI